MIVTVPEGGRKGVVSSERKLFSREQQSKEIWELDGNQLTFWVPSASQMANK